MRVQPETAVMLDVRVAVGRETDAVLWRNNVGVAEYWSAAAGTIVRVPYGLCVGSSDLIGIGPGGRFLAIECKTATGRLTAEQERFLALVERKGGVARVARGREDALSILREMRGV